MEEDPSYPQLTATLRFDDLPRGRYPLDPRAVKRGLHESSAAALRSARDVLSLGFGYVWAY